MRIELKSLTLQNFKGIKSITVHFESEVTSISGENGLGKTTIFDGLTWLLFGKDSHDTKDFNIKTLDKSGQPVHKLEHTVSGTLLIDGVQNDLVRTYSENWTRRRGSDTEELTGHTTKYLWNSVPLSATEYKNKIDNLVSEGLFKLLTSATYFNSLPWEKRRSALIQIAGTIDNTDIFKKMDKGQVKEVTAILESGKDLIEYKKEVSAKKKLLNDSLKLIPARIDEVQRSIPDPVDAVQIEQQIADKRSDLKTVEDTMQSEIDAYNARNKEIQGKQTQVHQLRNKLSEIRFSEQDKWQKKVNEDKLAENTKRQKQDNAIYSVNEIKKELEFKQKEKSVFESNIADLRQKWNKVSEESLVFNEGEFICPACKRDLDPLTIDERKNTMTADFEKAKSIKLTAITAEAKTLTDRLNTVIAKIKEYTDTINAFNEEIKTFVAVPTTDTPPFEFVPTEEYKKIQADIDLLELQVMEVPKIDTEALKAQKAVLQSEIDELRKQLTIHEQIVKGNARKKDLMDEESSLAQQISELERKEFAMESFTRNRMDMVEKVVNDKFRLVRFKMFETQLNGGVVECCECTVGGVPYSDVNSAGKTKAGLDIISTLSDHYNHYLPCFVDNAENINEIPPMKSQLIALYVTKDKSLIIK